MIDTRMMVALNADIVGYSRLMADDLAGTSQVVQSYRRLVGVEVEAAGGTLAVFVGDNFMALFDRATAAMAAAIAISTGIEEANAGLAEHRQVRFRMGVDLGEVSVSEDGQYFGEPLNVAARIQALALPGGVSVSGAVYRALDEPELRFRPAGRHRLKNIPESVQVYDFADLPSGGSAVRRRLALAEPTVAVLPIHTETLGPSMVPAARVIISDLLHRLASTPRLKVIDATDPSATAQVQSTFQYMLETGIHQLGENVRVYTRLIEAATLNAVFSHRWDARAVELFSLSDQVADEVARSLEVELVIGEVARLYAALDDPAAQDLIYRGWYHLTSLTSEGWSRALEYFEQVDSSHPESGAGPALLGFTHWLGAAEGWAADPAAHLETALEYARRALEIGDPSGLSDMVEAAILLSEGAVEDAVARLESVEITRPTCDVTFGLEGSMRRYLGQWEKSVESLDRAMRLTELPNPWYPTVQACSYLIGKQYEEAAAIAGTVLDHQPDNLEALLVQTAAQHEMGLERRARGTAELVRAHYPSLDVGKWLATKPYRHPDDVERWRKTLEAVGLVEPPLPDGAGGIGE